MEVAKAIKVKLKSTPRSEPGGVRPGRGVLSLRDLAVMEDSLPPIHFEVDGTLIITDSTRDDLAIFTSGANAPANRTALENAARHVVRVDIKNRSNVGTAVMVARGVAATCRHVITEFASPKVGGTQDQFWDLDASREPSLVLTAGHGAPETAVAVTGILLAADHMPLPGNSGQINYSKPEIAFVTFDPAPLAIPDPTISFGHDFAPPFSRAVAVIGFPSRDYAQICADAGLEGEYFQRVFDKMTSVFGPAKTAAPWQKCAGIGVMSHPVGSAAPNKKRLFAPHSAPTLPGASGGAVIDLTTGKLAGIHCSGQNFITNFSQLFHVLKVKPAGYPNLKAYLNTLLV
ncbi:MAG: trypsin-like peptidase domain-containing protein [Rhizobiaceae bacterium]